MSENPDTTRGLAPFAWGLCLYLESLKIFNTHYLVEIMPDLALHGVVAS